MGKAIKNKLKIEQGQILVESLRKLFEEARKVWILSSPLMSTLQVYLPEEAISIYHKWLVEMYGPFYDRPMQVGEMTFNGYRLMPYPYNEIVLGSGCLTAQVHPIKTIKMTDFFSNNPVIKYA